MGEPKQLLEIGGRPLLELVVAAACASQLDAVVVVLGARAEEITAAVDLGRARVVVNPDYEQGLSTSLRAGIASLGADVSRALVILGDQPDVDASLLDRLLDLQEASGLPAAALSFEGLLHPPMVLARGMWSGLEALGGDVGLRAVVHAHPELVAALPAERPGGHPVDIDTPEDFEQLRAEPG
ncbi:MAG: molybdenum cofactor cytidylyltransferase [Chloroflexota bacterium]|nr:molybdenum cofactor cytidylyltransferase [Chloroflexota bacterium]